MSWNTRESRDGKFRVLNKRAGILLWETDLPASGVATPASYQVNGRQYLVIVCSGGKLGTKSGDSYVAFAFIAPEMTMTNSSLRGRRRRTKQSLNYQLFITNY